MRRLALILLAVPAVASASIFDTFGFGSRGVSMGNALTAAALDYHATYYNPAQLMARHETHVGMGITLVEPFLTIDRRYAQSDYDSVLPDTNMGFYLGTSTTLGGVFHDKLAFGFAFFVPMMRLTRAESVDYRVPQMTMYENLPDKLIVLVAGAGEPFPWLRLGVGTQILADLDGSADVDLSLVDQRVTRRRLSIDLHADLAVTAGISVVPMDGLTFGVSYRESLDLAYKLPIRARIDQVGLLSFSIAGTSLYTPHQLSAGASWQLPWAPVLISTDVTWALWSHSPSPSPDVSITIDDTGMLADPEHSTPINVVDVHSVPTSLQARDVVIPRVGVEADVGAGFHVRGGYAYRPTPVPVQRYETNYVDSDAHVVSLGTSWTFADPLKVTKAPLTIGAAFGLTMLRERRYDKLDPADPTGDYTVRGNVFSFVLDLQHDF